MRQAAAEVFRLRGELLSKAAEVETLLDLVIGFYFRIDGGRRDEFRLWLLRQMPVNQRIDIFRRIVRSRDNQFMRDLVGRLEAANTFRNSIAHSSVATHAKNGSVDISSAHVRSSGTLPVESDTTKLEQWLSEMDMIGCVITVIADQIISGPSPFNPGEIDWPSMVEQSVQDGVVSVSNAFLDSVPTVGEDE